MRIAFIKLFSWAIREKVGSVICLDMRSKSPIYFQNPNFFLILYQNS